MNNLISEALKKVTEAKEWLDMIEGYLESPNVFDDDILTTYKSVSGVSEMLEVVAHVTGAYSMSCPDDEWDD